MTILKLSLCDKVPCAYVCRKGRTPIEHLTVSRPNESFDESQITQELVRKAANTYNDLLNSDNSWIRDYAKKNRDVFLTKLSGISSNLETKQIQLPLN